MKIIWNNVINNKSSLDTYKKKQHCHIERNGLSYAEIARQVDGSVTLSGVRQLCLRNEETKSVINKAISARKKCTNASDDREKKRICLKDRRIS